MAASKRWSLGVLGLACLVGSPAHAADREAIEAAINRGVAHIKSIQGANGIWDASHAMGSTALAALTLLECGVDPNDPVIQKATEALRKDCVTLNKTYDIALAILFFDRLGDPDDVPLLESLAVRLLGGQNSAGAWSYDCPIIDPNDEHRLKGLRENKPPGNAGPRPPAPARETKDLPPEILRQIDQLGRMEMRSSPSAYGDNSNTQFATLALWVAKRHGLPVERALLGIGNRFRATQNADSGWSYMAALTPTASTGGSTPAMTCAGLLGLAAAYGMANEHQTLLRTNPKRGKVPGRGIPKAIDPIRDPTFIGGLQFLAAMIRGPWSTAAKLPPNGFLPQNIPQPPPMSQSTDFYGLWSLERVAVVCDLATIGGVDWYAWGVDILLPRQAQDGSWRGSYPGGGADTCFAVLFLRKSNLAKDLTKNLHGKVQDPQVKKLRAGGVGALELGPRASADETPAKPKKGPEIPRLTLDPAAPAEPRRPADTPASRSGEASATELGETLLRATPEEIENVVAQLRDGRGSAFTETLAHAIPRLSGPARQKARDALAERLARMTPSTIRHKLLDDDPEVRRAAALATAMIEEVSLVPDLIRLLDDPQAGVPPAAHAALKDLTHKDFGPPARASRDEREKAQRDWKAWWAANAPKTAAQEKPAAEEPASGADELRGVWQIVSIELNGAPIPANQLAQFPSKIVFAGDRVAIHSSNRIESRKLTIDASKNPKEMVLSSVRETIKAIFEFKDQELRICMGPAGGPAPTEFKTAPASKQVLWILEKKGR